ncbi:Uncharacterised protein [Mycobacteroides abscessus subsp. abscessus]|nr:Uncharacterised protein [Mycobacteroides abscessus subsp. abscessus]
MIFIGRMNAWASNPVANTMASTACMRPSLVTIPSASTRSIPVSTRDTLGRCIAR